MNLPHQWRQAGRGEAPGYRCAICDLQYDPTARGFFCPGGDDPWLDSGFAARLTALRDDATRLSLDLRTARGEAVGVKKTTLRAVGRLVEIVAQELERAVERASK